MIYIIQKKVAQKQIKEMSEILGSYVKVAVDIERRVLAGGGKLHADCELRLLKDGSKQQDIWGADWVPKTGEVRLAALINIRRRFRMQKFAEESKKLSGRGWKIYEK